MTANEQQLFTAAMSLIDFAARIQMWDKDNELGDLPYEVRMGARQALAKWDHLRGDIGYE
jgi:hypothetical protein